MFANGPAIGAGGAILLVAEKFAGVIAEFSIEADGDLGNGRCFADLGACDAHHPDGITVDARGSGTPIRSTTRSSSVANANANFAFSGGAALFSLERDI